MNKLVTGKDLLIGTVTGTVATLIIMGLLGIILTVFL